MEPSRKNVGWVGGGRRCDLGSVRPSKACGRSSWFSCNLSPSWVGGCGWLSCWAPFRVRGIGVGFGNGWGQTSDLPCPGSLFGNVCGAWPTYQGYLAGFYHDFSRPLTSPQSSGRCLAFFGVPRGVGCIFGRAYCSALKFLGFYVSLARGTWVDRIVCLRKRCFVSTSWLVAYLGTWRHAPYLWSHSCQFTCA